MGQDLSSRMVVQRRTAPGWQGHRSRDANDPMPPTSPCGLPQVRVMAAAQHRL